MASLGIKLGLSWADEYFINSFQSKTKKTSNPPHQARGEGSQKGCPHKGRGKGDGGRGGMYLDVVKEALDWDPAGLNLTNLSAFTPDQLQERFPRLYPVLCRVSFSSFQPM